MSENGVEPEYRSGVRELSRLAQAFVCAQCHHDAVVLAGTVGLLIACPAHREAGIVKRIHPITARMAALEQNQREVEAGRPSELSMEDMLGLWKR